MASSIEIVVGTYEEFLLGYKLDTKNDKTVLTQTFADKSHSGTIKCLAVHNQWIATGSADDRIFIYDMRTRKQSQIILTHDGTVNSLAFTPDNTHLLSGSDDGKMIATRLNTWFTEATWKKAHSGTAVTHISCHPSGKLALSLGGDLVLRTWNLVKGRVAYKTNLKSRNTLGSMPDCLAWSLEGDYFTLSGQRVVEIWSIKTADVVKSVKTIAKPVSLAWIDNEKCLVGLEDGKIMWITINDAEEEINATIEAHKVRVKSMCFYKGNLATASSAGEIKLWQVSSSSNKLKEIAAINIGCRPTCIGLLDIVQFGNDYKCMKTDTETKEIVIKPKNVTKKPQRGVVTIEYENDLEIAKTTDEDVSESEAEDEKYLDNEKEEEENEEENDSDDSSTDQEEEPQIRLPKSRKRKQQILKLKSSKGKPTKFGKNQKKLKK